MTDTPDLAARYIRHKTGPTGVVWVAAEDVVAYIRMCADILSGDAFGEIVDLVADNLAGYWIDLAHQDLEADE